jgi:phosphomannomutase / phosphoglucomutase
MDINPQIYREYDVRGVVDKDLTPEIVRTLGSGFGTYVKGLGLQELVVGRDGRLSSKPFRDALVEGLLSTGCHVTDIGVCPTPVFYFSVLNLKKDGGVMITGSHNPPEFNGFKISVGKRTIFGQEIQNLRRLIEKGQFAAGKGTLSESEVIPSYQQYIRTHIHLSKRMNLVLDAGNGTAGIVAGPLLKDLGCEIDGLHTEIDGRFPNHFPDPTVPENLGDLIKRVKETGADAGIGFDGDGDRIGVVDDTGEILWGDHLMILFSRDILSSHKGATFIAEVKCSQSLFDDIHRHGGRAIMWKAGHSLIKEKIREEKAAFGGEMSGHMFFADRYFGFDDAIYSACRLAELLSKTDLKLSQILSDVPKTFVTPEIRVDCPDEIKFRVVESVKERLRRNHPIIDLDGVRVQMKRGWGLVRASNTQPVLVLRFEASTEKALGEIRSFIEDQVHSVLESVKTI